MIHQLTLCNFKSVGKEVYDFTDFDLLTGSNNSGKSTVLQALAIWQFCVDAFHLAKRTGNTGIQVVLPNFTALPVPEFNLLWKNRTDREWPTDETGVKRQKFILIEITVAWKEAGGKQGTFGVELRYHSPQTIYATPIKGWAAFRECEQSGSLPRVAYVPPFSGLEPFESGMDPGARRQKVGKGQPGSVLRNLLLQVCPPPVRDAQGRLPKDYQVPPEWKELVDVVQRWFSVELLPPRYDSVNDVNINVGYRQNGKTYDLIAGGSGFHQTMTLLAFLYGYAPSTILLDEPDAHLHVNLQREILDYFKKKAAQKNVQFLIATHSEELIKGVNAHQIISLLQQKPTRIQSTPEILRAMADVSNEEIARLRVSPFIVYVEGESDERLLRAWASACDAEFAMKKLTFKVMGGGNKKAMKEDADRHFEALRQVIPEAKRCILLDYDEVSSYHPDSSNPAMTEWQRKNIENYLLVPDAWRRAIAKELQLDESDLFAQAAMQIVNGFFLGQNLTLPPIPPNTSWRNVQSESFRAVNGKQLLFEKNDSLFHQLRTQSRIELIRERVAAAMTADEIHDDVHAFFAKLLAMVGPVE